jgi:hypothetical protein
VNARWRAAAGLHTASARLPVEGELPSFSGATGWLNSPPLTPASLRGKLALVDFWTYTCINWLRQLPYVRAWAGKYSGDGLVVIGDLNLVMGPATPGTKVRFRVLLDGQPPGAAHGTDLDRQGHGTAAEQRLYQLISQPGSVTGHTFEITFLDPGVQAYSLTFG